MQPKPLQYSSFGELLKKAVDNDFNVIKESSRPRAFINYDVLVGGTPAGVVVRKKMSGGVSMFVRTNLGDSHYSLTYFDDIDIIEMISRLDESAFESVGNYLKSVYDRSRSLLNAPLISVVRDALDDRSTGVSFVSFPGQAMTFKKNDASTIVRNGLKIRVQSFLLLVSLALEKELNSINPNAINIAAAKYYILSTIERGGTFVATPPNEINDFASTSSIRECYDILGLRPGSVLTKEYDTALFGSGAIESLMQSAVNY